MQIPAGFARLLANENISVRLDSSAQTAYFNTKSRVLVMPAWKCSERMRDMLIGHECAHAIFTDKSDLPTLVAERVGEPVAVAKDYLNVVEDARIDRLIQRRYAGLRRDYRAGYAEMRRDDYFGLKSRDPNSLPLIDRINLHFKGFEGDIRFDSVEQGFVDRIAKAESFDEVCEIAREIFERESHNDSEEEPQEQPNGMSTSDTEEGDDEEDDNSSQSQAGDDEDENEEEEDESESPTGESGDGEEDDSQSNAAGDGESEGSETQTSSGLEGGQGAPSATTLTNLEDKIAENVEQGFRYNKNRAYRLPRMQDIDLSKIVRDHTYALSEFLLINDGVVPQSLLDKYEEWKAGAKPTVNAMAQMFERKRAAACAKRSLVAKTGRLDMTNLHKYKMTEDIFLRNKMVPNGKNHGLLLFVDMSSSMSGNMRETMSQTTVLAMFCRRIGIPYQIYGFTTHIFDGNIPNFYPNIPDSSDPNALQHPRVGNIGLVELFSSKMKNRDFETMAAILSNYEDRWNSSYNVPQCMMLGGTPLDEAIIVSMKIASEFQKAHRSDILNTIWITDGEGCDSMWHCSTLNQVETGRVWTMQENEHRSNSILLRAYKDITGSNLIGIFLNSSKSIHRSLQWRHSFSEARQSVLKEQLKKDKFVILPSTCYDIYIEMDKTVAVYTGTNELDELPEEASPTRIATAFRKNLSKRGTSRVLLNTFTDQIAKEIV